MEVKKHYSLRIPTGKEYEELHRKANAIDVSKYLDPSIFPPEINPAHVLKYMNNASPPYRNIYARTDIRAIPLAVPVCLKKNKIQEFVDLVFWYSEELYERVIEWLKLMK